MADVVRMNWPTKLDMSVDTIFDMAKEAELGTVVITGYRKDGSEFFASSVASGPEALWLLERLKKRLLEV